MKFFAWLVIVALVTVALVSQPLAADHVVAVESDNLRSGDDSVIVAQSIDPSWVLAGLALAALALQVWRDRWPRPDPDTGTMARDADLDASTEWLTDEQIADALAR